MIASLGGLLGGMFSFANHGMWVDVGIDFYNLLMAFFFSLLSVVLILPESRPVFNAIFAQIADIILGRVKERGKSRYFTNNFWGSIQRRTRTGPNL